MIHIDNDYSRMGVRSYNCSYTGTQYIGVIMQRFVVCFVLSCLALSAYSQAPMQLLASIESPFVSDTNSWGGSIKGNGDINGDGYNDIVLVGQPLGSGNGRRDVYIYLGGSTVNTDPCYMIPDPSYPGPYHAFGSAIAYNGDLNGDGYCDLVISEPQYGYDNWGRVLIYFGGPSFDTIPDLIFDGLEYGIIPYGLEFGSNLDISGDFNGDGYNDIVISSQHSNLSHYGQVNIFFGGPDIDSTCDWFNYGVMEEDFGISLSVGDLNGDGFSDLAACSLNSTQINNQRIKFFFGGADFDNICDATYGEFDNDGILTLLMETDFNNDSYDDLVIFHGNEFDICWGSAAVELEFEPWHTAFPTNIGSIYLARFEDSRYLCYGTPQLETYNFYRWDNAEGMILDYAINENYNPYAATQLSYYLGDVNEDGHSEILLSNRTSSPILFKVFTTEYNNNSIDDYVITTPLHLTAYPNPFAQGVTLTYELKEPGIIGLSAFNIKGQLVARLDEGYKGAGQNTVNWNRIDNLGRILPPGVYLVKLKLGDKSIICKKVTLCY